MQKRKAQGANEKPTLTTTQYFNQAKAMLGETIQTDEIDDNGNPIYRPKYTKKQFETWLAGLPITDKEFDDMVIALDIDNREFYTQPQIKNKLWSKIKECYYGICF